MPHTPRPGEPDAFRLLVSAYHPDALRYPAAGPIATPSERLQLALTWNVFKTLEQIAPGAWIRRLLATSTGLPDGYDSAPHMTRVTCWADLEPAPSAVLRRGRRHAVPVSVIIETDDTVIVVVTPNVTGLDEAVSNTTDGGLLDLAEATAWLAGARSAYVLVVLPMEVDEDAWTPRIRQRGERVRRVLAVSPKGPANLRGIGATTWPALRDLLAGIRACGCNRAAEQRYADTTVEWMTDHVGAPFQIETQLSR